MPINQTAKNPQDFDAILLKLASPERIREWSHGEVTKAETINYRTQRAERNGLFDERIFGPEKDYECYCGKYRRIRYKNIICEKCGVEVTRSIVRRERMGHIELASPVSHIWFLRGLPSRISLLLGLPINAVEKVIYFSGYIVTSVNETEKKRLSRELETEYKSKFKGLQTEESKERLRLSLSEARRELELIRVWQVVDEAEYHKFSLKYGGLFEAEIGAEAIYKIFKKLNLGELAEKFQTELVGSSAPSRPKIIRRLNLVKQLLNASVRPEWMFLTAIPIIPPALRPMVALDGGRHATSDVNDLYRRVINRNNRLKKLIELDAPEVIKRNEKRILQEAVDALIDNTISHRSAGALYTAAARRPLKSLSDNLRGKQGRFRQNLLGKRVDYSGRSVIVVGPELHLSQCGLPKLMALELFRPFVIAKVLERELAFNIRGANRLIDEGVAEVWEILEEVIRDKFVFLNRAPTLHRLGIQAFKPVLVEGNAIQIHPLVCKAFNADFDGDQMAVHVPLSAEAQREAAELMTSTQNLLGPGNNEPIVTPQQDIILGCYWITKIVETGEKKPQYFSSPIEAILAYQYGLVSQRQKILVWPEPGTPKFEGLSGGFIETSVGRLLFNSVLPDDFPFINREIRKKEINGIVEDLIAKYGIAQTPDILDRIKDFGFGWAKKAGITWGIDDVVVPRDKKKIIEEATARIAEIGSSFDEGLVSAEEHYRMLVEVWQGAKSRIEKLIPETLSPLGSVTDMLNSGARGSIVNVSQMSGMKGMVVNARGEIVSFPIIPSYKEGLTPLEYFVATHGARKGLADTALKTARAGYLTRRLVYVSDSAIITEEDCGDREGRLVTPSEFSLLDPGIASHVRGRVLAADLKTPAGEILYKKGSLIYKADAERIEAAGIKEARVRSPLTCKTIGGLCRICYGLDLVRNELVKLGEPVGVVAAQATGEPGTQLTMRTFHTGGVAVAAGDITMGLPRVEELFERRIPKNQAILCEADGIVSEVVSEGQEKTVTVLATGEKSSKSGKRASKKSKALTYKIPYNRTVLVKEKQEVKKGDFLTDGPADLRELFRLSGRAAAESYIIKEVHKIYEMQGASIARKHLEVIVRQMFSRRRVKSAGDTRFVVGEIVEDVELAEENERLRASGGGQATADEMILGISDVALTSASFLAAASFENTQRVLTATAVSGGLDKLRGIKENVIIGRLIPTGEYFREKLAGKKAAGRLVGELAPKPRIQR